MAGSAYLYPLIGLMEHKEARSVIAYYAYYYYLYEILEMLADRSFDYGNSGLAIREYSIAPLTRDKLPPLERIMGSPKILRMFTSEMIDAYKIILGYRLDSLATDQQVRESVMNPGPTFPSGSAVVGGSLQSLVLYNPREYVGDTEDRFSRLARLELTKLGQMP